jgi:hypothetical protein
MITIGDKTLFDNYEEAVRYFNLTGSIIQIIDHPNSLEKILQGGNVVKCIGLGKTVSPGKPLGNQQLSSQKPILTQASNYPYLFPVFYKKGHIEYMGLYTLVNMCKKMSPSGFYYFEMTFHRQSKYYSHDTI